jgi:hypothetical protein
MTDNPHLALRMAAFSVAMQAKSNTLRPEDVDALRKRAETYPDATDPLPRAALHMLGLLDAAINANDRYTAGREMVNFIDRLNVPVPPGSDRRDTHG